jgi:GMP synthase (glutamine-hydrolysing)
LTSHSSEPQITVLDAGGQYCHLIARKVRDLGVYSEVRASDTPAEQMKGRKGIIISGGPNSVYEPGSPAVDGAIFQQDVPVLGICYGLQWMARHLGGVVQRGERGEYGLAFLEQTRPCVLLDSLPDRHQVWMSHRDTVTGLPPGFDLAGSTAACRVAAMADPVRNHYGVQFHPEVAHTRYGREILENFLFRICRCEKDWNPKDRIPAIEARIRETAGDRNVFFFVSGGVDSSVAYILCLRALGPDRVRGIYVDTGLMREGETDFVRGMFDDFAAGTVRVEAAESRFLGALEGVCDPERKRHLIGAQFVKVQEEIIESGHFAEGDWILGQGTIYPDTIESGGTEQAAVIKTHHNRVEGIQRLIEANCLVEPLSSFYKDEVREIGRELGLPAALLERHPFPGPGLAVRCLCSDTEAPISRLEAGWVVPVRSVGVQGDSRSYASVLALERSALAETDLHEAATHLINRLAGINRVIERVDGHAPLASLRVSRAHLTPERLARLRRADAVVRCLSRESGFDDQVWQFPVILIPAGEPGRPDSVVLRPIDSLDGMTAQSVPIPADLLARFSAELLAIDGVSTVFFDLTHKPPGTIEWE